MRIFIIFLLSIQYLLAQPYNHRLHNGEIQAFGHLIYELDSTYLCIGRGFDTLDYIRGMYATEIDKENGTILHTAKFGVKNRDVNFDRINNVFQYNDNPYFIFGIRDTVFLSTYEHKEIKIVKKIVSSIPAVSHFLYDFHYRNGKFYILTDHSLGEMNSLIFIYDPLKDTTEEIFFYDPDGFMSSPRMSFINNGNFLVTYRRLINDVAFQFFREIDKNGNTIWQERHIVPRENFSQALLQVDSSNYLVGAGVGRPSSLYPEGEGIPLLMNFNLTTKTITSKSDFQIPNNEWHKWNRPVEDIVQSHDGAHYLCVSELYDFPLGDPIWYSSAMVAKVDKDLKLIWKRKYKYIEIEYRNHDFQDIIATSDGNYLCYGTSLDNYWPPPDIPWLSWVIKIDEDGKIVGDTTTSVIDWSHPNLIDEISIFPNPAMDYIYINQDNVAQVRYLVFDQTGILEDEFEILSSYESVVKNISHWKKGMKIISMIKDNQQVAQMRIIKQ